MKNNLKSTSKLKSKREESGLILLVNFLPKWERGLKKKESEYLLRNL